MSGKYDKFIGMKVMYHDVDGVSTPAIVAHIEDGIGLTIVDASDTSNYLYCLSCCDVPALRSLYYNGDGTPRQDQILESELFLQAYIQELETEPLDTFDMPRAQVFAGDLGCKGVYDGTGNNLGCPFGA